MATDKGKPSDRRKESSTGIRPDLPEEKLPRDEEMTEKYTKDGDELADNLKVRHPNRNTDKGDATNAGGYKQ